LLEALGGVLLFFALSLVPWGAFGLGKVNAKSAGLISIVCGILSVIWAAAFIYPLAIGTAAVVMSFAFAFISAGFHFYFDVNPKGHGILCWTLAMIVGIAAALATNPATPFLTFAFWSYFILLVLFGGGAYIGSPTWVKGFAYFSLFVGIVTTGIFGTLWALGVLPP